MAMNEQTLVRSLSSEFTVFHLESLWWTFTGDKITKKMDKATLTGELARVLTFKDRAAGKRFLEGLPEMLAGLITEGCTRDLVSIEPYEKKYKVKLIEKVHDYYSSIDVSPKQRIHCFKVETNFHLTLHPLFIAVFSPYVDKPEIDTALAEKKIPEMRWSNGESFRDNLPLVIENIPKWGSHWMREDRVKKGFLKSEIKAIRARSGLEPFPASGNKGVDSIELFSRYLSAFHESCPKRPANMEEWVRETLDSFFTENPVKDKFGNNELLTGAIFEQYCLCEHLSLYSGNNLFYKYLKPPSRATFKKMLLGIGEAGGWHSIDALLDKAEAQGLDRSHVSRSFERSFLFIKGESIECGAFEANGDYEEKIPVNGPLHRTLVYRPLFCAYFYLMAVLGIVEIAERETPQTLLKNDRLIPSSPYEALSCVKITPFGAWCLGIAKTKPKAQEAQFEAIADSKLLLVTFKGKSLERKLYLQEISIPAGEERYRITEASFIRDCAISADVQRRVDRFKSLIAAEPGPHWLAFFDKILKRAAFYDTSQVCLLFKIPMNDASLKDIFVSNEKIAKIAKRVEGGFVAVRNQDFKKFISLMAEYGILPPPKSRHPW